LGPEASGTLKHALQYYLEYEREFVGMFFPRIVERNRVNWADVSELTARQADALRPLLADSVRYFRRQADKERSRSEPPFRDRHGSDPVPAEGSRKADLWASALKELCDSFQLSDPLETDP
jgi:hypothetical protein